MKMVRSATLAWLVILPAMSMADTARAQDVPGIEICTVEKDMVRRTSCLQSNVDFLKKTITQASSDSQRKLDAANRQIEALKNAVVALQKSVGELQAVQQKPEAATTAKEGKNSGKDSGKDAANDGTEGSKK
jgi:hypothetical protein